MRLYILLLLIALLSTFLLLPAIRRAAIQLKAVNEVRERDMHSIPTPRMGGVAMYLGFLITCIWAQNITYFHQVFAYNSQILWILIGAGAITLVGVFDDIFNLDWTLKLGLQIMVAIIVAVNGVQLISLPIFGLIVGSPFATITLTVFIIVGLTNATNFIDGLDGLLAGVMAIGSSAFFIYSYFLSINLTSYASLVSIVAVILVGVNLGYLIMNFSPARIFMGDSGSMLLGFLTACITIMITGRISPNSTAISTLPSFMPIMLPILLYLLPLLDMTLAVIRRLLQRKSPFEADKKHLHHRFAALAHSKRAAVLLLYLWTSFVAYGSLLIVFQNTFYLILVFGGGFLLLLLLTIKIPKIVPHVRFLQDREIRPE